MRITDSTVSLSAAHSLTVSDVSHEALQVWGKTPEQIQENLVPSQAAVVELSEQGLGLAKTNSTDQTVLFELSDEDKRKIQLIEKFIEALTGKKLRILLPEPKTVRLGQAASLGSLQPLQGWGLRYERRESHSESEKLAFSAAGIVKTADGRQISFTADLAMSRSFYSESYVSIRAGDALKDPLVINYDSPAARLTDTKYRFDIDADGKVDQISFVQQGSGFLAIDKNNDGRINDGSELFGTASGDGFADLAAYDGDSNGWIDENDAIFNKLRIWTKDAEGKDYLLALGQVGVGAIFIGKAATEFALNDANNVQHGQIRSTGIFLRENGLPGTVQQIDLAV